MNSKLLGGLTGTTISLLGLTISTEQLEQIISIACSITGVIIVVVTSLIIPLVKWYKKSKEDGKITKEELEEGKQIISDGVNEVKDKIDDIKK